MPLRTPTLHEATAVGVVVGLPAGRLTLEVVERARGLIDDPAAARAHLEAEVDVLVAIAIALVEATDGVEGRAPDGHAGAGHALQLASMIDGRERARGVG